MISEVFNDDQKQYLEGFVSGAELTRAASGLPTFAATLRFAETSGTYNGKPTAEAVPTGPDSVHLIAQNRFVAEGKKLCPQEEAKRKRHPLDMWDDLTKHAAENRFPKGDDVLAFKYHGLFYVAPAQNSYMCRLRMPGGILTSHQFRGIAKIAEQWGGGFADATTRANLQIRDIQAPMDLKCSPLFRTLGSSSAGRARTTSAT